MAKAKQHIHYHKHTVVGAMASSNTWIIGMLLVLASIIAITWYNFSTFHDVKGAATKAAVLKNTAQTNQENNDTIANGCFVLKGNFAVLQKCGTGLYRYAQYSCGDNTKIKLGSPTSCKSVTNWLSTIAASCKGHTSCDAKTSPTPRVSGRPTPTPHVTGFPTPKATPTIGTQK